MDKSYDKLKNDKLADEGKKLYQQGKTITGNMQFIQISQAAVIAGSIIARRFLSEIGNQKVANISSTTIALGGTIINAALLAKSESQNKKLRAYYAH